MKKNLRQLPRCDLYAEKFLQLTVVVGGDEIKEVLEKNPNVEILARRK